MAISLEKYNYEFDVNVTFGVNVKSLFVLVKETFNNNAVVLRLFDSAVKNKDTETLFKIYLELTSDKAIVGRLLNAEDIAIQPVDAEEDIEYLKDENGQEILDREGEPTSILAFSKLLEGFGVKGIAQRNGRWTLLEFISKRTKAGGETLVRDIYSNGFRVYDTEIIHLEDMTSKHFSLVHDQFIEYFCEEEVTEGIYVTKEEIDLLVDELNDELNEEE